MTMKNTHISAYIKLAVETKTIERTSPFVGARVVLYS